MKPLRKERLQEAIREEISKLLIQEMNDERLRMVTITEVDLSVDQKYLRVYFSTFPGQNSEEILKALEKLSGFLGGEIARRLRLRFAPEVRFGTDNSIERGVHMVRLLEELEDKGSNAGPNLGTGKQD